MVRLQRADICAVSEQRSPLLRTLPQALSVLVREQLGSVRA
jgi:hypothetical protein